MPIINMHLYVTLTDDNNEVLGMVAKAEHTTRSGEVFIKSTMVDTIIVLLEDLESQLQKEIEC